MEEPQNLRKGVERASHRPAGLFLDQVPIVVLCGTDLGNVSHVIASIHPMIDIGGTPPNKGGTPPNKTAAFTRHADTDEAHRAILDGGLAVAWTALDAATDPAVRSHLLARPRLRWPA